MFDFIPKKRGVAGMSNNPMFESSSKKPRKISHVSLKEIKAYVKTNSWFSLNDEADDYLHFDSREYGDVGEEQPGADDIKKAQELGRELIKKYGKNNLIIQIDTVDEWTILEIYLKK